MARSKGLLNKYVLFTQFLNSFEGCANQQTDGLTSAESHLASDTFFLLLYNALASSCFSLSMYHGYETKSG